MMISFLKIKKTAILPLILALVLASALCACAKKPQTADPALSDTPVTGYTLVRGDASGKSALRCVVALKSAINSRFGKMPTSTTDWATDTESNRRNDAHELLVGITNRQESVSAYKELEGKFGWIIRTDGAKVVLAASSARQLDIAVQFFIEEYLQNAKNGYLPSDINEINIFPKPGNLLCGDGTTLNVAYPENASAMLKGQLNDFVLVMKDLGVNVLLSEEHSGADSILVGYDGALPYEASLPAAVAEDGAIRYTDQCLLLNGRDDRALCAVIAELYDYFRENIDETLDGTLLLYCPKDYSHTVSWSSRIPRLIGGTFLQTEVFSANGTCDYYENVPENSVKAYVDLLTNSMNFFPAATPGSQALSFSDSNGRMISLNYNRQTNDLVIADSIS